MGEGIAGDRFPESAGRRPIIRLIMEKLVSRMIWRTHFTVLDTPIGMDRKLPNSFRDSLNSGLNGRASHGGFGRDRDAGGNRSDAEQRHKRFVRRSQGLSIPSES